MYEHPLRREPDQHRHDCRVYRLMPGDFVVRDKGTGFVHCAPAHGKEDFDFARRNGLPLVSSFTSMVTRFLL